MVVKPSPKTIDQIREYHKQGIRRVKICERLNVTPSAVQWHTRDLPKRAERIRLTEDIKQKIRERVAKGESRYKVANELGVTSKTVYNYTNDLPKREVKKLDEKIKKKIRQLFKEGFARNEIANMFGISYGYACLLTRDLSKARKRNVSEQTLEFLEKLMKDGCFVPKNNLENNVFLQTYRRLKERFQIKRVKIYGRKCKWKTNRPKVIYFLEGRNLDALRKFIEMAGYKVINFQVLAGIASAFGVRLSRKEMANLFNKGGFAQ